MRPRHLPLAAFTALAAVSPAVAQGQNPFSGGGLQQPIQVWGDSQYWTYGQYVRWIDDITGDGKSDYLATWVQSGPYDQYVRVCSGASGLMIVDVRGEAGCGAGDVDADGVPDFATGDHDDALGPAGSGMVWVWSGADGQLIRSYSGDQLGIRGLGGALDGVGDLNGDGYPELAVGAPDDDPAGGNSWDGRGSVTVFSGIDGSILYRWTGVGVDDQLGQVVRGLGDVSGDGVPDLLFGSDFVAVAGSNGYGAVYVHSGADGSQLWSMTGVQNESLGRNVSPSSDLDGDGLGDVIVTAPFSSPWYGASRVLLLAGTDGSLIRELFNPGASNDRFAGSVSSGDIDGDGIPEQAVYGVPVGSYGAVHLFSGASGDLIGTMDANYWEQGLGFSLDLTGDRDGDRLADLLIGAPWADGNNLTMQNSGLVIVRRVTPYLFPEADELSLSDPGVFGLGLNFPESEAGMPYVVLASPAGHGSTQLGGLSVPLADDPLLQSMAGGLMPVVLLGGVGHLDQAGRATAAIRLNPAMQHLVGHSIGIAAITLEPGTNAGRMSSLARRVTVVP